MSLPTRSNLQGSVTSANSNVSGGILPNPYAQEALELQSTMLVLQQQLQTSFTNLQLQMNIGITRINKLVEMSTKVGAMTPDMISQNSSGSVSGDHDSDRPKSHLHRIPERPTVMLTGRKVDIETPADSMRSSMAVLSGGQAAASTFILSSAITSPQSGTSFIVLPSQQQQHDRYQYHDLKQHATAEPTTVTALPIVQMSANALPLLQINKAAGNNKLKRDPTTKSQVSAISATSQKSNTASMPPSSPSLGVKWDDKDYIRAASQESRKMVSNYDDIKRAKSTSYQPETLDTPQPALSNIRRKTDATIGTDSSLTTNSSVSPSATSIGKWVSKIVLGVKDPEPVPRNTVSASNLPEVYSKTVTTIGRPKNAPFAGSRRTSIAGSLLQAQEDDGRQSRSPLFNIIHPVDTGDSSEFGTTHSVDMKTDNPEEHLKTQQQQQNQWEREPSWKNVERGTPGKSIFEQAEIGSRVNDRDSGGGQRESVKSMAISSLKNNFSSGVVVSEKPIPDLPPMPQRKPAKAAKSVNKNRKKTWKDHLLFTSMFEDRGFDYFLSAEELEVNVEIGLFSTGIHTNSPFASLFTILTIWFYFFLIFYWPFRAAFYSQSCTACSTISFSVSAILILESLISFVTPPMQTRKSSKQLRIPEKLDRWQSYYLKYYLAIDIFSAVPWSEILTYQTVYFPLAMICLIRTLRLPRMVSQNPFFEFINMRIQNTAGIGNTLSMILSLCLLLIIYIHIQACILYFLGETYNFTQWNLQFTHWSLYPGGIEMASPGDRYVWMILQSIGNIFPLEFIAGTSAEQIAAFIFSAIGAVLYAILIGLVSSAAISYDAPGKLYRQKIDELTEYLHWKQIDNRTSKKLLDYYDFKYRGKYFEESSLLADMNESLRREISTMNCKRLIEKVPFLKRNCGDGRDDIFMGKIATALVPVFFVPGDYVFNQGERSTEMFFVLSGTVNIIVNGCIVASFDDGNFFGEVALIANIPRTASVQAATACNLYSLSAKDFQAIILEFEDIRYRIDQIYEERMMRVRMEQGIPEDYASSFNQSIHTQRSRRLSNMF